MALVVKRLRPATPLLALALLAAACASKAGAPEPPTTPAGTQLAPVPTASAPATVAATPQPAATDAPPPTASSGGSVTIDAVGDISLARQLVDRMTANGPDYPYALIAPLMDADIGFANLEGALTDGGNPWPKGYNFRTPPPLAAGLPRAHVDVVTLANNHAMDYGPFGLMDTVQTLDVDGVRHIGAGANAQASRAPAIIDVRGMKVAFLGYVATPDESGGFSIRQWAASDTPGVALGSADAIASDVAAARQQADFVIVAVHAGDEYRHMPNATQRALADAALAAGADAYIGAHPHVVQPVEMRGKQLVAWSLGNFIFDLDNVDLANIPTPRVSLILKLTLTKGAGVTSYEAIPVVLDDTQDRPRPATEPEAAALRAQIAG